MAVENYNMLSLLLLLVFSTKYSLGGLNSKDFLAGFSAQVEPNGYVGNLKSVSVSDDFDKNWLSLGTPGLENEEDRKKRQKIARVGDHLLSSKEIGTSVDLGGKLLRKSIEPKFQLNSDSYDSEILRNQRQNFHAKSFDRPKLNPLFNFQGGIDVNQKSGILVPTRSNLKNDIDPLDNRLNLQNSATSSPASTSQNELQSRRDRSTLLDIPEFARSQGINYDKNKPNLYFEQPHVFSSDANEHSVAESLLSLQQIAKEDKISISPSSTIQTSVSESLKKRKSKDFRKSEKKFGEGFKLANIGYVQAKSGGAYKDSDQYHSAARNGKNVMQDNHATNFSNAKIRALIIKKNKQRVEKEIVPALKNGFEHDLMKLIDLGTPLIQLDLIKEFGLKAKSLKRKQTALSIIENLSLVENQIKEHGGTDFFVTDDEVLKFLSYPLQRNFVINYSNSENSRPLSAPIYTTALKNQLRGTDFSILVVKLLSASGVNPLTSLQLGLWKGLKNKSKKCELRRNFAKKSTIGKLFLVYSIIINKIFCNGPEDSGFTERQVKALEFYQSVFGNFEANHKGLYKIPEHKEENYLVRSNINKAEIDLLLKDLNTRYVHKESHRSRQQFWIAWNLVELWLIKSRNKLHQTLKNRNIKIADNFKPFINNIVYALLELNK
ncbi:hypothetical protein BY996DRAFT_6866287 [Phakopsora pachyrhizi]|nr:hypothetical protein BY996DRAFT_6866287 [Phakopsora pachyrhizi]